MRPKFVLGAVLVVALSGTLYVALRHDRAPRDATSSGASSQTGARSGASAPASIAGPRGRVTVRVFDEGQPLADRRVVFQDGDGNVITEMKSGADGKATAEIPAGGMITVAQGVSVFQLVTFMGMMPGDDVIVGEAVDEEGQASVIGSAKVRMPGKVPGAARYIVTLGVGPTEADPMAPVPLPVIDRFVVDQTKFKALAEALDANGEPLAFAFAWAPWDAAKTKAHGEVDVRLAPWSTAWRLFDLAVANAPAEATSVEGKLSIYSKDEDRFDRNPRRADLRDGKASLHFSVPPQLGTEARMELSVAYGATPDKSVILRRAESMEAKTAIDLEATLLPRVSNAEVDAAAAVAARPAVRWKVAGDASKADVTVVRVAWPATREHVWTVLASPTTTRLTLPALPESLREWAPDGRPMTAAAAIVEASFYAGFDDVRKKGTQLMSEPPEDEKGGVELRYSVTGNLQL